MLTDSLETGCGLAGGGVAHSGEAVDGSGPCFGLIAYGLLGCLGNHNRIGGCGYFGMLGND